MTYPHLLWVVNGILWCVWWYAQLVFWYVLRKKDYSLYESIGGPKDLLLDISVWKQGKTFLFFLKGRHRRLPDRGLGIIGDISLLAGIAFCVSLVASVLLLAIGVSP